MNAGDGVRDGSWAVRRGSVPRLPALFGLCVVIAWLGAEPVFAQVGSPDKGTLLANIESACPIAWEPLGAGFIGGAATVSDPWAGSVADRDDFVAYLQSEMVDEGLTQEELYVMAADPMAVVAECSYQKLRFLRLMALQASDVASTVVFGSNLGSGLLAVPDGSSQALAAESCDAIAAAYPNSPIGLYWIDGGDGSNAEQVYCTFGPPDGSSQWLPASSCKAILDHHPESPDGVYWLDVNGAGTEDAFEAFCDMTGAGGGWTLVAAQFESDPATDWNEGIQPDYDPTLASGSSFALHHSQLPPHAQTAFGKHLDAVFVDYVDFVYSTGNIDTTLLVGLKTGKTYHVHRNAAHTYSAGDPENTQNLLTDSENRAALTFDETGGTKRTWWFRPRKSDPTVRGRQLLGNTKQLDSFGWTVWVR